MTSDPDLRAAVEALPEELDQWADTFEEERAQGARSTAAFARALVRAILAEDPVTPAEARACAGCRQALREQRVGPVGAPLWTCATAGCPGNLAERFGAPTEPDAGGEGLLMENIRMRAILVRIEELAATLGDNTDQVTNGDQ